MSCSRVSLRFVTRQTSPDAYTRIDEVRALGRLLNIPEHLVNRHPFPGPGLAIRILGPVTRSQVQIAQRADTIYLEEVRNAGLYGKIAQAFAVLLPVRAVGVMGDKRTYEQVIALRAVQTEDFMTADWFVLGFLLPIVAHIAHIGSISLRTY